jgi:hypothetical protein
MLQAQLQFIEKHYGAPGCGWLTRQIALSQVYKQHAVALNAGGQARAAFLSLLRALAIFPFGLDNIRTGGSLLLQYARSKN